VLAGQGQAPFSKSRDIFLLLLFRSASSMHSFTATRSLGDDDWDIFIDPSIAETPTIFDREMPGEGCSMAAPTPIANSSFFIGELLASSFMGSE
jgi:hypothetical protein